MRDGKKIGIAGGDARMEAALRYLLARADAGERVLRDAEFAVWGIGTDGTEAQDGRADCQADCQVVRCRDAVSAVRGADAVILPLPVSRDGMRLFAPNAEGGEPDLLSLIGETKPRALLLGGRIPRTARELGRERGLTVIDYFEDEAVQIRNAVPTAEGAVAACIGELPVTVAGLRCAVLGYGRVGRTLAQRLAALGARVTAAARSARDLAWAEADGCDPVPLGQWKEKPIGSAVFNTIPARILDGEVLSRMGRGTVVFELAPAGADGSQGCDLAAAEKAGIRVVLLPSLPGKCAPETAGEIIARAALCGMEREFAAQSGEA